MEIYRNDIERLQRLYGIVSYLNDPSKDDGVCVEFGYAFAKGAVTVAFVSDIQFYKISGTQLGFIVDPILHRMLGFLFYFPYLKSTDYHPSPNIDHMERFAQDYVDRLNHSEQSILDKAEFLSSDFIVAPEKHIRSVPEPTETNDVFIDFIGNRDEWCRDYSDRLRSSLESTGLQVAVGRRFDKGNNWIYLNTKAAELGEKDILGLLSSRLFIVAADGAETDAGSAALIGIRAYASQV